MLIGNWCGAESSSITGMLPYIADDVSRTGHALLKVGRAASHMQYWLLLREVCSEDASECCVTKEPLKECWLTLVPSCRKEGQDSRTRGDTCEHACQLLWGQRSNWVSTVGLTDGRRTESLAGWQLELVLAQMPSSSTLTQTSQLPAGAVAERALLMTSIN